jgi:hypothetical protein
MAMIRNWRWLTLMAILVLGLGLLVGYRQLAAVELTRISAGGLLMPHDLSSLAEEYPIVVAGRIVNRETGKERVIQGPGVTVEYESLELKVTENLRGSTAESIALSVPETSKLFTSLTVGEDYVVFLNENEELNNAWGGYVVGYPQGVWELEDGQLTQIHRRLDPMSMEGLREFLASLP